jgi:hypothetical protein
MTKQTFVGFNITAFQQYFPSFRRFAESLKFDERKKDLELGMLYHNHPLQVSTTVIVSQILMCLCVYNDYYLYNY